MEMSDIGMDRFDDGILTVLSTNLTRIELDLVLARLDARTLRAALATRSILSPYLLFLVFHLRTIPRFQRDVISLPGIMMHFVVSVIQLFDSEDQT